MLEKQRFLAIKNLASDIRDENAEFFKNVSKKPVDEAIDEKNKLVDSIIDSMEIAFSDGDLGKEERQVFRANFLIPDDQEFYKSYTEDKNIRNLMNKYAVSIEDIMGKISELNVYSKYLDVDSSSSDEFIDELTKLSEDKSNDLIDEMDDLSNEMSDLDSKSEIESDVKDIFDDSSDALDIFDGKPDDISSSDQFATQQAKEAASVDSDDLTDDDFDDEFKTISDAVTSFIGKYDSTQDKYSKAKNDLDEVNKKLEALSNSQDALNKRIEELEKENNELKSNNLESAKVLAKEREEKKVTVNENLDLKSRVKALEKKQKKSEALLKKIYDSISEK